MRAGVAGGKLIRSFYCEYKMNAWGVAGGDTYPHSILYSHENDR